MSRPNLITPKYIQVDSELLGNKISRTISSQVVGMWKLWIPFEIIYCRPLQIHVRNEFCNILVLTNWMNNFYEPISTYHICILTLFSRALRTLVGPCRTTTTTKKGKVWIQNRALVFGIRKKTLYFYFQLKMSNQASRRQLAQATPDSTQFGGWPINIKRRKKFIEEKKKKNQ